MADPIQFTDSSPRFGLPFLFAGQAQKEFFVNEAHARVDTLLHPCVEGESISPPLEPVEGQAWLVGANPDGDWLGHDGAIAGRQGGTWLFFDPQTGMRIYDRSTGQFIIFITHWVRIAPPTIPDSGAVQDAELRATFADLIEALRNAGIFPVTL